MKLIDMEIIRSENQWLECFNQIVGYQLAENFENRINESPENYPIYEVFNCSANIPYRDMRKFLNEWTGHSFYVLGKRFEVFLASKRRPFNLNSVTLIYCTNTYSSFLALRPEFEEVKPCMSNQ